MLFLNGMVVNDREKSLARISHQVAEGAGKYMRTIEKISMPKSQCVLLDGLPLRRQACPHDPAEKLVVR